MEGSKTGRHIMTATITKYRIIPGRSEAFKRAAYAYVSGATEAAGNIMAEAFTERDSADHIWIAERWETADARSIYRSNAYGAAVELSLAEALAGEPDVLTVEDLEPLTREEWRRQPDKTDSPFVIMLTLQAKPGTEGIFEERYHRAMPDFRAEKGIVTYQLSRYSADHTRFITYEKFRSEEAFQYHLKFPPIGPVIDFLRDSIQDPPFEKGLHFLELIAFNEE